MLDVAYARRSCEHGWEIDDNEAMGAALNLVCFRQHIAARRFVHTIRRSAPAGVVMRPGAVASSAGEGFEIGDIRDALLETTTWLLISAHAHCGEDDADRWWLAGTSEPNAEEKLYLSTLKGIGATAGVLLDVCNGVSEGFQRQFRPMLTRPHLPCLGMDGEMNRDDSRNIILPAAQQLLVLKPEQRTAEVTRQVMRVIAENPRWSRLRDRSPGVC